MNNDILKVRLHIGASPDIDIHANDITTGKIRMTIYKWLIFQIEDLDVSDLNQILNFIYRFKIKRGINANGSFAGQEITIEWIFKDDNSVSLNTMDQKKTKGLTDKELIEKYGDKKAPGFNKALSNTDKKLNRVESTPSTPLKGVRKTK